MPTSSIPEKPTIAFDDVRTDEELVFLMPRDYASILKPKYLHT